MMTKCAKIIFLFAGTNETAVEYSKRDSEYTNFDSEVDVYKFYIDGCQSSKVGGSAINPNINIVTDAISKAFVSASGGTAQFDLDIFTRSLPGACVMIVQKGTASREEPVLEGVITVDGAVAVGFSRGGWTALEQIKKLNHLTIALYAVIDQVVTGKRRPLGSKDTEASRIDCSQVDNLKRCFGVYADIHRNTSGIERSRFWQTVPKLPEHMVAGKNTHMYFVTHQDHFESHRGKNAFSRYLPGTLGFLNLIRKSVGTHGCDVYLKSARPDDLTPFKNSYLLIDDKVLLYVNSDGKAENVTINDFHLFKSNLVAINPQKLEKIHLSDKQIAKNITSNGGHTRVYRQSDVSPIPLHICNALESCINGNDKEQHGVTDSVQKLTKPIVAWYRERLFDSSYYFTPELLKQPMFGPVIEQGEHAGELKYMSNDPFYFQAIKDFLKEKNISNKTGKPIDNDEAYAIFHIWNLEPELKADIMGYLLNDQLENQGKRAALIKVLNEVGMVCNYMRHEKGTGQVDQDAIMEYQKKVCKFSFDYIAKTHDNEDDAKKIVGKELAKEEEKLALKLVWFPSLYICLKILRKAYASYLNVDNKSTYEKNRFFPKSLSTMVEEGTQKVTDIISNLGKSAGG